MRLAQRSRALSIALVVGIAALALPYWLTTGTAGLVAAAVIAGMLGLVIGTMQYVLGRRVTGGDTPGVIQTREIIARRDAEWAARSAVRVLQAMGARSIRSSPGAPWRISARTRWSWKSFGEKVDIEVVPFGEREAVIRVTSRPFVPSTIADYGKGFENVKRILQAIIDVEDATAAVAIEDKSSAQPGLLSPSINSSPDWTAESRPSTMGVRNEPRRPD